MDFEESHLYQIKNVIFSFGKSLLLALLMVFFEKRDLQIE